MAIVMIEGQTGSILPRLRELQSRIREVVVRSHGSSGLHEAAKSHASDTIYKIDTDVEPVIDAFMAEWGKSTPLVLIAEGMEDERGNEGKKIYPQGTREEDAVLRIIMDPIDGTRGIMYDKRPAWSLAGVAANKGEATRLRDIEIAMMTELPTSKMGYADVLWAVKGQGATGVRERIVAPVSGAPDFPGAPVDRSPGTPLALRPSAADHISHGFAMVANFFPDTKVIAAELMEHIARNMIDADDLSRATVFDDQYISTGGQFYELIVGHDRFNADLRPYYYKALNKPEGLCCHPYDCATLLIAEEAGVIVTDGQGQPLDGPMDCVTGLSWAGYANRALQRRIQPFLVEFLKSRGA